MPIDTSMYPTQQIQPQNPLTMMGQVQGVQNAMTSNQLMQAELPIRQQQAQQAINETLLQNAKVKGLQMLNDPKYIDPEKGTLDANTWIADMAKNPETAPYVPEAINSRSTMNKMTQSGVNPSGQPTYQADQAVAAGFNPSRGTGNTNKNVSQNNGQGNSDQDSQSGTPTKVMSVPPGFTTPLVKSRENYDEVSDSAKNMPNTLAAYNEVINLNKAGALTGTRLADAYQIAARNDPFHIMTGATDQATKSQEIQKWIAQGLLQGGMPNSDAKLQELQHGNLNPDQLPQTINKLAPFFKAVAQGSIEKQNYYNRVTNGGQDLSHEPTAKQQWDNNYDPRWIEFDQLPNKQAQHQFLVEHPDLLEKQQAHKTLQGMGVVKGVKDK